MTLIERIAFRVLIGAAALLLVVPGSAQTLSKGKTGQFSRALHPLAVHAGGRVQPDGRGYRYRWPGVYFETTFSGPELVVRIDDPTVEYRLLIDDRAAITIDRPARAEFRVAGLTPGSHRARLEKVNEGSGGPGRFGGFFARAPGASPPRPRSAQIEYIGDSSMTGFGLRASDPACAAGAALALTDTPAAYPALIARRIDADYQVNAISGRGLVRNYGLGAPERTLSTLYPNALRDIPSPYRDPTWRPHLYVLSLMADFASPIRPGERWASLAAVADDYVAALEKLAAELHRRSPDAAFAIGWPRIEPTGDPGSARFVAALREATLAAARKAGFARVGAYEIDLPGLQRTGCGGHYSAADQRLLATRIFGQLARQRLLPTF
ncbi:acetylxylan esterase [Sphingomonas sp.]|uniref:acetylxylan esterase n=1 Tax=Sphingomonas sp. TaxID=28214 RepID=UPI003B3AB433